MGDAPALASSSGASGRWRSRSGSDGPVGLDRRSGSKSDIWAQGHTAPIVPRGSDESGSRANSSGHLVVGEGLSGSDVVRGVDKAPYTDGDGREHVQDAHRQIFQTLYEVSEKTARLEQQLLVNSKRAAVVLERAVAQRSHRSGGRSGPVGHAAVLTPLSPAESDTEDAVSVPTSPIGRLLGFSPGPRKKQESIGSGAAASSISRSEVNRLHDEIAHLRHEASAKDLALRDAQVREHGMTKHLIEYRELTAQLRKEVAEGAKADEALSARVDELSSIQAQAVEVNKMSSLAAAAAADELGDRIKCLEDDKAQLVEKLATAVISNDAAKISAEEAQRTIKALEERIASDEHHRSELEMQLAESWQKQREQEQAAAKQGKIARGKMSSMEEELRLVKSKADEHRAALNGQVCDLEDRLSAKVMELDDSDVKAKELLHQVTILDSDLAQKTRKLTVTEDTLEITRKELQSVKGSLDISVEAREEIATSLRRNCNDLDTSREEKRALEKRIEELNGSVNKKEEEIGSLTSTVSELQSGRGDLSGIVTELEKDLASKTRDLDDWKQKYLAEKTKVEALEAAAKQIQVELEAVQQDGNAKEGEQHAPVDALKQAQARVTELESALATATAEAHAYAMTADIMAFKYRKNVDGVLEICGDRMSDVRQRLIDSLAREKALGIELARTEDHLASALEGMRIAAETEAAETVAYEDVLRAAVEEQLKQQRGCVL